MKCKQCGKENADNEKYCFYCGTDLSFEPFMESKTEISTDNDISDSDLSAKDNKFKNKNIKKSKKYMILVSVILLASILTGIVIFVFNHLSLAKKTASGEYSNQNLIDSESEKKELEDKGENSLAAVVEYDTRQELEKATYFKNAFASSVLPDQEGHNYAASNVLHDDGTCWCEDASDYGEGEWIQLDLPEMQRLSGLHIVNGYAGTEKQYDYNSKLSRIRLDFSDGNSITVDLQVFKTSQRKTVQDISFNKPVETEYVRITILSVKSGDCKDTCLTFVEPY